MHANTKVRIFTLCYLVCAYAVALPALALLLDLVINGAAIDIWQGAYSFADLLRLRKELLLNLSGPGAAVGFVYWFFFCKNYRHHDPLDKYFK